MSRIACLRIPQFQIAVHQKHEAELKGKAFVLLHSVLKDSNIGQCKLFMCSDKAKEKQIVPDMKLSEAKAIYGELLWRKQDPRLYQETQKLLVQELVACSPRITTDELGIFLLDASGLTHLGGETKLCRDLLKLAAKLGFTNAHVGIADSAFAAEVASRLKHKRSHIVPTGNDIQVLAPLSIWHLPISFEMKQSLADLGVKSMEQLLNIPVPDLIERFGLEALLAVNLAQGQDTREPKIPPAEKHFECFVELGAPVELLNDTLFVLKSMVDRLVNDLNKEELAAEEFLLSFYNDNDNFDTRPVSLLRPSNNNKFLLEVLRLSIEAKPLAREFTGIKLSVNRFTKANWQQNTIEEVANAIDMKPPSTLSPSLLLMLQRFNTRLGANAVVQPAANDQHIPEYAGMWIPVLEDPNKHVLPLNTNHLKVYTNTQGAVANLVLKKNKEPIPILVKLTGSSPSAIAYQGRWYRIKQITTPDRLSGMWWDKAVYKSYYIAEIEPHSIILLTQQHFRGKDNWYLEGFFD